MKPTIHLAIIFFLSLLSNLSFGQSKSDPAGLLYGDWVCVKHYYRGLQKFSAKQAEQIRKSTLSIRPNTYSFSKAKFVKQCHFYKWQMHKFDLAEEAYSYSFQYAYTKPELAKMGAYEPVDAKGEYACFNECSGIFMKKDTVIMSCGGYAFFWLRKKNQ
ncbi:hypothetical protein D0C36_13895 [Mucilaginibacter conchicola]|uniref:Uncharacterized protein n=1 Tax=Mucilaginibacter conchicola TaxID=2303333 RepID=A0A372NTE1_9SPHI|nr:hypothetical protein [Mucilaginibacter conchicola]RFZ92515.1 hypothetical protein D0C36_13895 [Mucilaginibacter conchicola]